MIQRVTLLLFLALIMVSFVIAEVPQLISYQGRLTNSLGDPVTDGIYSVTFTIYDSEVGGNSKWSEVCDITTKDGLFSAFLGSINPLGNTVFSEPSRYLGIKVGADAELSPRWRLASAAYANRISTVDGASGGVISSELDIQGDLMVSGKTSIGTNHEISGMYTFISGKSNIVSADFATVGGGQFNYARGTFSVIAGGGAPMIMDSNVASGDHSSILGGGRNRTSGPHSAIGGGCCNTITDGGQFATIGGGAGNTVTARWGTVPGGVRNTAAGEFSFAAGRWATANHVGSFVWADSINAVYESQRDNQFLTRATGGNRFDVNNSYWIEFYDDNTNLIATSCGASLSVGGNWVNASDRNQKENFAAINSGELLEKIAELPITSWNYKNESEDVRHIGPVAQDFRALFGVGSDDKHISTIDPAGIALAEIKELVEKNKKLEDSHALLMQEIKQLRERMIQLEQSSKQ